MKIEITNWLIIRSTLRDGRPTPSRALWGIVKNDPSHLVYESGEILLRGGVISVEAGIVETIGDEKFKLCGQGREIQVPLKMLAKLHRMTQEDWSNYIIKQAGEI